MNRLPWALVTVFALSCTAPSAFSQVYVPLLVEEHNGISRTGEVVSMGVPFAVGKLQDADIASLCVKDSRGTVVPAQFLVLNRWWAPHYDDSIRWLLVTFPATASEDATANYTLIAGSNPPPTHPVAVSTNAGLITVDTGVIKAVVNASGFKLFDSVWYDANGDGQYEASEKAVTAAADDGLVITSGDWPDLGLAAGQEFRSSLGSATVTVEESGPVRAVLCINGTFTRPEEPPVSPYYEYDVRMYFYAGSPMVRCHVTLKNNRVINKNVYTWPIEDFDVRTTLNAAGSQYALLGQSSPVRGTLGSDTVKIYQDSNGTDTWQALSGSSVEKWLNPWDNGLIVRGVTFRGYQIYDGSTSLEQNNYARGWMDVSEGTVGVAVGVKDFWQQYPKALRTNGSRVEVGLLPTEWSEPFSLAEGSRKRHEVIYDFHAGALTDQQLTDLYTRTARPLFTRCAPMVYVNSGAWDGGLGIQPPSTDAGSYDKYATTGTNIGVSYGWDWFGWYYQWNPGGTHPNEGSMFMDWILNGNWHQFESSEIRLLWTELAKVVMFDQPDMDLHWHYLMSWPNITNTITENRYPDWYSRAKWGRPDSGHCGMFQNLEYYYLTGDRHALEDVLYYGQYSGYFFYDDFHLGYHYVYSPYYGDPDDPDYCVGTRYWGWPVWNLAQAYEASGDPKWLGDARLVIAGVRNSLRRNPLKFASGSIYPAGNSKDYYTYWPSAVRATSASQAYAIFQMAITARAAGKYYQETGDDDAFDVLIGHGDFLVDVAANRDPAGDIFGWPYCWADYWGPNDTAGGGNPSSGFHEDLVSVLGWAWQFGRKATFTNDLLHIAASGAFDQSRWKYAGYLDKAVNNPPADMTPLPPVTDLKARDRADGTVLVRWTAPSDNSTSGRAARYQLKYSTSPIVERITNWPDMTAPLPQTVDEWKARAAAVFATHVAFVQAKNIDGEPTPAVAGIMQSMVLPPLQAGQTYYLAIKSLDGSNNLSDLSNVTSVVAGQYKLGDINADNYVNVSDLQSLIATWGTTAGTTGYDPLADLNEDGYINVSDLQLLASGWNG